MHLNYATPAVEWLRNQLSQGSSAEHIAAVVSRAEKLYFMIDSSDSYVDTRVTQHLLGQKDCHLAGSKVSGDAIQHDLRRLVEDLTSVHPQKAGGGDPVLTTAQLAQRFSVSVATVSRWRREGLIGRYYLIADRKRIGFSESSVRRFATKHRHLVERAAKFRQLTEAERGVVVKKYRHLRRKGERRGDAVRRIARELRCGRETVQHVVKRWRAEHVFDLPLDYMPSPEFRNPEADKVILSAPPPARAPRNHRLPAGLPRYLAALYETPLLTVEQERHLFRKFNYLKYKANKLRRTLDLARPDMSLVELVERLYDQALEVKSRLIRANLRLVVHLAKQRVSEAFDFYALVSDGNLSLIRAIEKFDYTRGFKFSTYATWAIIKNFSRSIPAEMKHQNRFHAGPDQLFDAVEDERADHVAVRRQHVLRRWDVNRLMTYLNDREQDIIVRRFGLDYRLEPQTLQQIGDDLGVSKERVRQLQSRAMEKLREAAARANVEVPDLH